MSHCRSSRCEESGDVDGNQCGCVCVDCEAENTPDPQASTKETFDTGAQRDRRGGKGRYDLISPIALRAWADVCEHGAKHYGDRNWEKGMPLSRVLDSALRHLHQWQEGYCDEDHLGHALWNVGALIHLLLQIQDGRLPAELDDVPPMGNGRRCPGQYGHNRFNCGPDVPPCGEE